MEGPTVYETGKSGYNEECSAMKQFIRCTRGHYREQSARFCVECEKMEEEPDRCSRCGMKVDREANYCSNCRNLIHPQKRWMAAGRPAAPESTAELFVKVDFGNSQRGLANGIVIKEGEEALLFAGQSFLAEMHPGKYSPDWFASKLKGVRRSVSLIILRKGVVDLAFALENIRTADPVSIAVACNISVRIEDATPFTENVAKGKNICRIADLKDYMEAPLHNAVSDLMNKKSVKDLRGEGAGVQFKKHFEVVLEHHLAGTLKVGGLYFDRLKSIEYDFKNFGAVAAAEEEGFIRNEKDAAEAGELERRIEARQRTASLLGDLSSSDEKIEEFLLEEEKAKLLRRRELQDIKTALEERDMDHRAKREWIIRKLELDQELDYERRRLLGKAGLEREVAEARYAVHEAEAKLGRIRLEDELGEQRARWSAEAEKNERKEAGSLKIMQGLAGIKKQKDRDTIENELFRERERLEIALQEKENEARIQRELIEMFRDASPEAMIAVADPGNASTLAKFLAIKHVRDYSPEQIMAIFARDPGEMVRALMDHFISLPEEERRSIAGRITEEKEKARNREDELHSGYFEALEQIFSPPEEKRAALRERWAASGADTEDLEEGEESGRRGSRFLSLRCLNPSCKAAFSVKAEGEVSLYKCPKCGGSVEYN